MSRQDGKTVGVRAREREGRARSPTGSSSGRRDFKSQTAEWRWTGRETSAPHTRRRVAQREAPGADWWREGVRSRLLGRLGARFLQQGRNYL